ncbi:Sodium/calcium exchanger protein-domain-containing protein [Xylariomycetidae sp. FL2044]|nr:Sodium/calcium exchanger protein-domain-containing protein [Xylariomycetidae sp. FL2044]
MPRILRRKRKFSSRPFYTTVLLFSLLAVYSFFLRTPSASSHHERRQLVAQSGEDCRLVHSAQDKCAFVRRNCHDDEAGLVEYLTFYYCSLGGGAQPVTFVILVLWLGLLFTTIGIAASDFFSINLSTIATILGLSESLAGVTFLAFGNGSPDVFSTFAAMGSNSGSMAVGELIGAAGFITSVVAGSMALVREFKVNRNTFVRDVVFFIAAVGFAMVFLYDGNLHLWECCVMIGFYLFYVIVVVSWHAFVKRRKARRAKETAARIHVYTPDDDELAPYRDDPEEEGPMAVERRASGLSRQSTAESGMFERGPRIEVGEPNEDADETLDRGQHVAAEVNNSMRVVRPRGRRNTTTITPIRPSLIGALEFRSVLSSLQKEANLPLRPTPPRSYSADRSVRPGLHARGSKSVHTIQGVPDAPFQTRNRSLSSGAVSHLNQGLTADDSASGSVRAPSPHTIGGRLAPPADQQIGPTEDGPATEAQSQLLLPQLHRLRIPVPSENNSPDSSPAASPFPTYTESPLIMATEAQQPPPLMLPTPATERNLSFSHLDEQANAKPIRWWPYHLLPPPHVLSSTLFPTLQGWPNKSVWDKFISVLSVPSIFLLAITLPVVESDTNDEDSAGSIIDQHSGVLENATAPVSFEPSGSIEPETEWQRYRRSTVSRGSSANPSPNRSPALVSLETSGNGTPIPSQQMQTTAFTPLDAQLPKSPTELAPDNSTLTEDDQVWNRWLLILQIFTGPLFCVFVIWANMQEELDSPVKVLVRALLISLVCSLVLLAVLLATTSPDRRPKYHFMFCFLGFLISIAWISTVAGEVVGVLKAFGVILDISEAILGLTVFAVGNSIGDLVADITVARLGYPVMALSACFGGPLLNILLGIGLGGAFQTIHAANKRKHKHPDRPFQYKPYHIQVSGTLMVSAIALLITLLALLIFLPINKWVMSRRIGWGLITLWSVSTVVNLAVEVAGVWREIA